MYVTLMIVSAAICTLSFACSPTQMSDMTTSTASATTTMASVGRRKRFAETVVVTVVSDEPYDNSKNVFHLNRANELLSDIASSQGIKYSKEDVLQKIKNQGGNFAVEYTIMSDVDCYALRNFIVNAKKRTTHFSYATVECDDGEFVI